MTDSQKQFTESDFERDLNQSVSAGAVGTVEEIADYGVTLIIDTEDDRHENWVTHDNFPGDAPQELNTAFVAERQEDTLVFVYDEDETQRIQEEVQEIMTQFQEEAMTPEEYHQKQENDEL